MSGCAEAEGSVVEAADGVVVAVSGGGVSPVQAAADPKSIMSRRRMLRVKYDIDNTPFVLSCVVSVEARIC
jgi:hypothetical protein